ncbi:MAG: ribosomal protein S18-alanine N-acetyltransferase [Candidatus Cloacimonetes bacterium]|nr:ribosomal protein S18-alanine N-acetyltransferase [Candidatus Cloacimonadota bacterium]
MELSIRPTIKDDFPRIISIEQQAFVDPWPSEAFTDFLLPWSYSLFHAGELVGYVFYSGVDDEMVIINFAIQPSCHHQGWGDYLLRETMNLMIETGVRHFFLDVRASNVPARRLYQKNGFSDLGIRKNYYRHPEEDAIVMVKHIT